MSNFLAQDVLAHLNSYISGVDLFASFSNMDIGQVQKFLVEMQRVHNGILNSLLKKVNSA